MLTAAGPDQENIHGRFLAVPRPAAQGRLAAAPSRLGERAAKGKPISTPEVAMPLTVAVQMDPIERIKIAGDSTFALMLEAQARGHRLLYYTPERLSMRDGRVVAPMQPLMVRDSAGDHFTPGDSALVDLASVDVVLLRQDPPFDMAYITSTHLLERVHPRTLVVNDPASVRNAPEKIFVTQFPDLMPPTLITRDRAAIEAFRAEQGDVVMKPLYGNGGAAVFKVAARDPNFGSLFDLFSTMFREPWVVQRFLPAVVKGDKRIILVDGRFAGAVNRVPAENDIRSNMVRGGAAESTELTPREREICEAIGPALKQMGLLFTGIDVIDGNLTEINVTSPTGIRAIKRIGGPDLAVIIWDAIEANRRG
jgi:glutathione synthase